MCEITYIWHDCFLLRAPSCNLLFDYWLDPTSADVERPAFLDSLDPQTPFYVFVSHFHKDHFNKAIFKWMSRFPRIRYIISHDVAKRIRYLLKPNSTYAGEKIDPEKVIILQKGESYEDALIKVDAFGSTDIGNSYAVTVFGANSGAEVLIDKDICRASDKGGEDLSMKTADNLTVFHAGDLNCWAFRDSGTPAEIRAAENAFRSELKPIAEKYPRLDVAFFPVDSRIGSRYWDGAAEFVRKIHVNHFFPMHFTLAENDEERTRRIADAVDFRKYRADSGDYIPLTTPYQNYFL